MKFWLDAQLSPALGPWLAKQFHVTAVALRDLGLRDAEDLQIFGAAKEAGATVITKDRDFVGLVHRLGPPPQILLITVGNTSNTHLQEVLFASFEEALALLAAGEPLVEVSEGKRRFG